MSTIDQSIIEDAEKAGFTILQDDHYLNGETNILHNSSFITDPLIKFAQLREARQSSQSEPVAIVDVESNTGARLLNNVGLTDGDLLYAAPQQAIPSEKELASIVFTAMDENGLVDPDWVDAESVSKNIAKRILHYSMLSASPTAPIERDK
jgi:hypothetical protein